MTTFRLRRRDVGSERARWLARRFGQELRLARVTAGMTQRQVGVAAGVPQQRVSRAERGSAGISLDARCRMVAATGHELGWKLYPVASVRLRDSGQLGLAQVIVAAAHPTWTPKFETPVAPGDLRAADLLLDGVGGTIHVEIERVLLDVQAQLRSGKIKREILAQRLGKPVQFLLAVADTRANRDRMAPFTDLLARALPVSSREAWNAIRSGAPMVGDGMLLVRPRKARTSQPER